MELVHRVVIVQMHVVVFVIEIDPLFLCACQILCRTHAFHKDHMVLVYSTDPVRQHLCYGLPQGKALLTAGSSYHRFIHQSIAQNHRLVCIPLGNFRPEGTEPLLIFRFCPECRAVPLRLITALRIVHVQHQPDSCRLCPCNVGVQPAEAFFPIGIGFAVRFKHGVVQIEPHGVKAHVRQFLIACRIVILGRGCGGIRPHIIADCHAFDEILLAVFIDQQFAVCADKAGIAVLYFSPVELLLPQQCQVHAVHNAVPVAVRSAGIFFSQQERL